MSSTLLGNRVSEAEVVAVPDVSIQLPSVAIRLQGGFYFQENSHVEQTYTTVFSQDTKIVCN